MNFTLSVCVVLCPDTTGGQLYAVLVPVPQVILQPRDLQTGVLVLAVDSCVRRAELLLCFLSLNIGYN